MQSLNGVAKSIGLPGGIAARLVELARRYGLSEGKLLDLGAGLRSEQAVLQEAGLEYLPLPLDAAGFDLGRLESGLDGNDFNGSGSLGLVCLSDLAGATDLDEVLRFLRRRSGKGLVMVAPNLGHQDMAARLLAGNKFDRKLALGGFTGPSLLELVTGAGWELVEANNLAHFQSEQHDQNLLLHQPTLAGDVVRKLAETFNPDGQVTHFVWLLRPSASDTVRLGWSETTPVRPAISILIRTQGLRKELLTECLYSIYVQDCPFEDYEVLLALQSPPQTRPQTEIEDTALSDLRQFLENFPPELVERIRIIRTFGEGHVQPTNPLVEAAQGQYMFFLDDDDMLLDGALPTFLQGIAEHGEDGVILHSWSVLRRIEVCNWQVLTGLSQNQANIPDAAGISANRQHYGDLFYDLDSLPRTYPYTAWSIELYWKKPYQPVYNHYDNQLPPPAYAWPRRLIEQTRLRFDPEFEFYNDWEFLMRATSLLKVVTLPIFASCINLRSNNSQTMSNEGAVTSWKYYYDRAISSKERQPLLLEGRAAREIVELGNELKEQKETIAVFKAETAELRSSKAQSESLYQHVAELREYIGKLETNLSELQNSPSWKLTTPLRKVRGVLNRIRGSLKI